MTTTQGYITDIPDRLDQLLEKINSTEDKSVLRELKKEANVLAKEYNELVKKGGNNVKQYNQFY